ncbi:MAG: ABC transporter ATP-binding protein [Bacteroidota bacterium]
MNPSIQITGLSKKYRIGKSRSGSLRESLSLPFLFGSQKLKEDFWALDDVSFTVETGECLGIIGRNGAGKSSLLKIISRITHPTKGRIVISGRTSSLLEVGTGFHPELTGRENIYLNGTLLGMKRAEVNRKMDEIIAFSGIEKFIETPVKFYSSGMYVRLAFSVAAHLEPDILIIDEVLAVGDAEFQRKCLGKMQDVATGGRTVIFVSHDLASVEKLCTRCILLEKGQIAAHGKPGVVIQQYFKSLTFSDDTKDSDTLKIKNIKYLNYEGTLQNSLNQFDDVVIRIECYTEEPLEDATFAIGFNSNGSNRVTTLWSGFHGKKYSVRKGDFYIDFKIPKLHIIPGEYQMMLFINAQGLAIINNQMLCPIFVGCGNVSPDTEIPKPMHGFFQEDYEITVEKN